MERIYLCIDLKSFFASVECAERGLDSMTTDLVVADPERGSGTICLAVSPSMKAKGIRNRCRVYEIPKGMDYIMAPPRMQKYIDYAAEIYNIYIHYISPEDIHVYSIDEAFLDITFYLKRYAFTPKEMAVFLMEKVYEKLGIRAAAGIGTNLYLAKIALDITAKHAPDFIGALTEESYRETLWDHMPLTDFWMIGPGMARRLAHKGIYTMRHIACADEDMLYREFGVDAELLIDHAYGRETATIENIHSYRPKSRSLSSGQVLLRDYNFEEARLIVREMTDAVSLELVRRGVRAKNVMLTVGYSVSCGVSPDTGSVCCNPPTDSDKKLIPAMTALYDRIAARELPIRRIILCCDALTAPETEQMSLFENEDFECDRKNRRLREAVLTVRKKHGKNSLLKAMNLNEAGTMRQRNGQIGGHKSG